MAETKKWYPYNLTLLYNLANDIAEMYKAKITADDGERFAFTTKMYGHKAGYVFRMKKQPGGCLLSIETEGGGEKAARRLSFMLSIVDGMLASLG